MELVDRFLSSCSQKASQYYLDERENFQLLVVAAYYVSVKTMEQVAFGSDLLALLSNGSYTKEEIERTEKELLHGLGWRINPPTAMQFAFHIMSVVTPHIANIHDDLVARMMDETAYQAENSVRDYSLSQDRSSSIAVAALINAAYQLLDSGIRREFLLALCCTLVENFAHPKELQMARLRLQSVVDSCETAYDDTTHLPKGDESAATQFITALEVSAVYRSLDGCGPMVNDTVYIRQEREKPTCFGASSLDEKIQSVRRQTRLRILSRRGLTGPGQTAAATGTCGVKTRCRRQQRRSRRSHRNRATDSPNHPLNFPEARRRTSGSSDRSFSVSSLSDGIGHYRWSS